MLLRALVNPCADQTDLFRRERLDAGLVLQRRHPGIPVFGEMRDGFGDEAVGAVAGLQNRAHLGALEHAGERVQVQAGFGLVAAVALDARGVEDGLHVGGVSHARLGRGRRQRGGLRARAGDRRKAGGQSNEEEVGCFHSWFDQSAV